MNHGPLIFLGILFTLALSWCGLVFAPQNPTRPPGSRECKGSIVSAKSTGTRATGRRSLPGQWLSILPQSTGAAKGLGADLQRGWGKRYSVAQDYLRDVPVMLGNLRIGPDLANIGLRRPDDETHTNLVWHLQHLYNPQITSPGSIMPPYPFLFREAAG